MSTENPPPALRLLTGPLDALWRLSVAPSTAVVLLALSAATIGLGLVLPQAPSGVAGDSAALNHLLADLQVRHGAWVGWPARAGLLSAFATPAWRLLLALLSFVALVATADSLLAWRQRAGAQLFPWHLLAHVGVLLLLAGALVDERWGWEQERLLLGEGAPLTAGQVASPLLIERTGGPATPGEAITIAWRQGMQSGQAQLAAGRPLVLGKRSLHLLYAGMAVRLRLIDAADRAIPLDDPTAGDRLRPEVTLRFQQAGESRYVSVPSRDWVVRLAYQPTAPEEPTFALWVYRGLEAAPLAQASLTTDGVLVVGEHRLRWEVLPCAGVRVASHPGLGLWLAAWLLVVAGLAAALRRPSWLWALATVGLVAVIELAACKLHPAGSLLAAASRLLLTVAAASTLPAASAGVLARLGRATQALAGWPHAAGWALLAAIAGGGLTTAGAWAASGSLWHWEPGQACWALTACLFAAAWHGRKAPGGGAALLGLALAAVPALLLALGVV